MTDDGVDRVLLAMMLVSGMGSLVLGIPSSRRVLVAWMTWASLRWRWRRRKQSVRRWLWIITLRHANGKWPE